MTSSPVYVYDGDCVLCSRAVHYVLRHDRSDPPIRFVAIMSELGRRLSVENGVNPDNAHTFLYLEDDRCYLLTDAVFAMARRAGGPGRLILLFQWIPRPIRDWVYGYINRNRYYWFGRLPQCYVPTPETRSRFVLESDPDDGY